MLINANFKTTKKEQKNDEISPHFIAMLSNTAKTFSKRKEMNKNLSSTSSYYAAEDSQPRAVVFFTFFQCLKEKNMHFLLIAATGR
jgi:hypothetical protein